MNSLEDKHIALLSQDIFRQFVTKQKNIETIELIVDRNGLIFEAFFEAQNIMNANVF